ncbi:hypothetical protein PoB_006482300 [Plakobranchus ocellatus]|uniref:Uncharacterized protein n=1 Tax=Plakobranchus ocellatus TaxID=259542 RepID=A0AAV4D2P7_9GAST|nr:hypothetical protein PoB_006482300 [Plakobranchus ocellatus]
MLTAGLSAKLIQNEKSSKLSRRDKNRFHCRYRGTFGSTGQRPGTPRDRRYQPSQTNGVPKVAKLGLQRANSKTKKGQDASAKYSDLKV